VRIDWAIPCRYVEVVDGLATIVGAGANIFTTPEFPTAIGLMVAIRIAANEGDNHDHLFGSRVLGPDMEPVTDRGEIQFNMGEVNPAKPAGWEQTVVQPVGVQFPAEVEGQYTLELTVDDRSATVPLVVQTP